MTLYAIPASSIVSKLNTMSYNSARTIRTITVAVFHSIYSQSVCEPARGAEDNACGQYWSVLLLLCFNTIFTKIELNKHTYRGLIILTAYIT